LGVVGRERVRLEAEMLLTSIYRRWDEVLRPGPCNCARVSTRLGFRMAFALATDWAGRPGSGTLNWYLKIRDWAS